jgi:hypothetical protein
MGFDETDLTKQINPTSNPGESQPRSRFNSTMSANLPA